MPQKNRRQQGRPRRNSESTSLLLVVGERPPNRKSSQFATTGQSTHPAVCWRLTPSSHDLNRPEAKRIRVKLTNFNIAKIDLVEVFIDLLEAESFKSKDLADEYTAFMPADVAAVIHSAEQKPIRINELDQISRQEYRTWPIYAASNFFRPTNSALELA